MIIEIKRETMPGLKTDAVEMIRIILPQLPFNSIDSYSDQLFEAERLPDGSAKIQDEIAFLKNTKLNQIVFKNTDTTHVFFTMENRTTQKCIQVSNRFSTRNELRGRSLRQLINETAKENPNQTAYDCISQAIKSLKYSDMLKMLKGVLVGNTAKLKYGKSMSEEHFNLFCATLLAKLNEKIAAGDIPHLEPKAIRDDDELQKRIWQTINVERCFDATGALEHHIHDIKVKATELMQRRFPEASAAANSLHQALTKVKNNLVEGTITSKEFITTCIGLVKNAQKGELKNHRGFFGKIWHGILTALHILTFGMIPTKPTHSIQKLSEIIKNLDDLNNALEEDDESLESSTIPHRTNAATH